MAFLGKWGSVLRDFIDENQTLGGRLQNARARQGLSISEVANHYQYKNEPVLTGCGGYHITSLIA